MLKVVIDTNVLNASGERTRRLADSQTRKKSTPKYIHEKILIRHSPSS